MLGARSMALALLALLTATPALGAYDCSTSKSGCTPLDDYVAAPDDTYKWVDMNITIDGPGWTAYLVNLTSQTWLTSDDWDFAPRSDGSKTGSSPVRFYSHPSHGRRRRRRRR